MINIRKYYISTIVIIMLITVLSGCQEIKRNEISGVTVGLNLSMEAYFNQEYIGIGRGKVFEVKVIRLAKITSPAYNDASQDSPLRFYYYDIVIAPISEVLPLQIKNVIVYPTDKAKTYFLGKQTYTYPAPEQYEDFISSTEFKKWDKVEDLFAYEYMFVYSNLTDSVQTERGISTQDLDSGMATVDVSISYNDHTEKIRVSLMHPIEIIDSNDHPLLALDDNIAKLYNNEKYSILFRTFINNKVIE